MSERERAERESYLASLDALASLAPLPGVGPLPLTRAYALSGLDLPPLTLALAFGRVPAADLWITLGRALRERRGYAAHFGGYRSGGRIREPNAYLWSPGDFSMGPLDCLAFAARRRFPSLILLPGRRFEWVTQIAALDDDSRHPTP